MATVTKHPVAVASKVQGLATTVQSLLPGVDVVDLSLNKNGVLDEERLHQLETRSVLLCDPSVVSQLLDQSGLPLKWLHCTWAGLDKVMTLAKDKQVQPNFLLTRTGLGYGQLIGEYVIGHVIAHERRFKDMFKDNEAKKWNKSYLRLRPLTSLTIGILGLGQIGGEIARFCKNMGMTVWGLTRSESCSCPHVHQFRGVKDLAELLSNCDYVCSILPSTPETRDLLSGDVLASCKEKKSIFINVGRGDVVKEESLVKALNEGWIGGAILDVFVEEPLPQTSPLWSMTNVTISPHCSGPTLPLQVWRMLCLLSKINRKVSCVGRADVVEEERLIRALNEGWSPLWSMTNVTISPHCSRPNFPLQVAEGFVHNYHLLCEDKHLLYQVNWTKGY